MGFKTIVESDTTISLGGLNSKTGNPNPTSIEGYYLGSKQIKSDRAKSGFSFVYNFQTADGNVGVWGKTDMDRKMTSVPEGAMARITFSGKKKIPGKNDMYTYTVEVDTSNTLDTAGTDDSNPNAEFDPEDPSLDETDLDADAQADAVPYTATQAPKQATPAPDAARAAKVKALLDNKGTPARK